MLIVCVCLSLYFLVALRVFLLCFYWLVRRGSSWVFLICFGYSYSLISSCVSSLRFLGRLSLRFLCGSPLA